MTERTLIWFKGECIPTNEAMVPVLSPTAQFGLNVFEGIRGYSDGSGQLFLFRLADHLQRLSQSCRLIGIKSPYSLVQIDEAIQDIVRANNMKSDLAVRVTLFVDGFGSWSSSEPVNMVIAPIHKPRNILNNLSGKKSCISTWTRINDNMLPPRIKAGANYINGRYAYLESLSNGYDVPIFLNTQGKVSESAGACIMMLRNGNLVTPPRSADILESITRSTILTIACETGLSVQERNIDRTELYLADEIFLCGSSAEIMPITHIDRFIVGDGIPGPMTRTLSSRYFSIADSTSADHHEWRTPVWTSLIK
jgi:branched-chain amino acid aminotransferase